MEVSGQLHAVVTLPLFSEPMDMGGTRAVNQTPVIQPVVGSLTD